MSNTRSAQDLLKQQALGYHAHPKPGKLGIIATKPMLTQADLALAYTPGVAAPVLEIAENPELAYQYTSKGNLVAVISDGTAVLGLGNVGPLASKPVMEGKAVLFKKFTGIDVFDLEIKSQSTAHFIEVVASLEPTFGGINLEDIKAPECFEIETALKARLSIPVFHDDQHGTAVVVAAGLLNALILQKKSLETVKLVCLGAGAAGIATIQLLVALGLRRDNIILVDRKGVIHTARNDLNQYKREFATSDPNLLNGTLADALENSDVLIGVSGPNLVTVEMIQSMADNPVIFALSNPDPEIRPDLVYTARPDAILATGRSDYPNQVNNVLCFPYLFHGALSVRAREINQDMLIAAVQALQSVAQLPIPESVLEGYPQLKKLGDEAKFGKNYLLPTPADPRLLDIMSQAVSQAAIASGVATA